MKIVLSETWHSQIYAEPFYQRFRELGVEAIAFKEIDFFYGAGAPQIIRPLARIAGRIEMRYRIGPALHALNRELLATVDRARPDAVFLFRGDDIFSETIVKLRDRGIHVVGWNNDDPFSRRAPWYAWRHFARGIPHYDRLWAYRQSNAHQFRQRGCQNVGLLRSFYLRELNYPIDDTSQSPYRAEVSFIGHWEDDGRERYVERLLDEPTIDFKLWGTLWERSRIVDRLHRRFGPIRPLLRDSYNLALNSAGIALVFLSKLNNDTYTRRCFEIPATGTMMLSEYTSDLASMFREGEEAEYFRDADELVDKVHFYARNVSARQKIGAAGRARLLRDGHEAMDRARLVLETLQRDLGAQRAPRVDRGSPGDAGSAVVAESAKASRQ